MSQVLETQAVYSGYGITGYGVLSPGIQNQPTQRKLLNFENWTNGGLSSLQKSEFLKLIIFIFHEKKLKN